LIPTDPLILGTALLLDLITGDPHWLPHPVVVVGKLIRTLDTRLRRDWLNERLAGVVLLVLVVVCTALVTWGVLLTSAGLDALAGWIITVIIASTCLAARSLHKESSRVAVALASGDLDSARQYLSYIVGRDAADLAEEDIWRAVVETVAENTSDGIIAPFFWLTLGGPVAAMSYKAVSTLDSMVGYRNQRYIKLGWASARMDDLLNYVPARLSALLLVMAAPLSGCSFSGAIRVTLRDRLKHPSPNSGHPEAAAAGALGVRLGGTARYSGVPAWKEYIGDQLQPLDGRTYRRMIRLMYISTLLMAAICMVVAYCLRGLHVPFI
jgi:adenosylcobinamide-phosphate synthase